MMTLEERNRLAESIVDQGGVWQLPFNGRNVEVEPVTTVPNWTGRTLVKVMAVEGKPFVHKVDWGEGICRTRSAYKNVFPESLVMVTPDKEGVGKKE